MNLRNIGGWARGTGLMAIGAALLMVGVALPALAATAAPLEVQPVSFTLSEFTISPSALSVLAGDEVAFTARNTGQFPHDVHIEGAGVSFEIVAGTGNIPAGQSASASFTFSTPGTYQMWCPVGNHRDRGMVGTFTVRAAGPAGVQIPGVQVPSGATQLPKTGDGDTSMLAAMALLAGAGFLYAGYRVRRAAQ